MFVLDSHCDTPSQILRLRDISIDGDHSQVDLPKLAKGGVNGAFWAFYIPASLSLEEAAGYADRLYRSTLSALEKNKDRISLTLTPRQALQNQAAGKFSVFFGLENASPIGRDAAKVSEWYDRGVRYITLCHSRDNEICDSCASDRHRWNGLSPFGKEVVAEMNRLGMLVDVSHISDKSFFDVLEYSSGPVAATHSCCRAIADHPRNMTDDMLRALAANGGVVQINFYPVFLDSGFAAVLKDSGIEQWGDPAEEAFIKTPSDEAKRRKWYSALDALEALPRPPFTKIADHIDYVVNLIGIDSVGLGSDFDGIAVTPRGMESAACFHRIFEELRLRGYSERDLAKIASGNFFRLMK